MNGMSKKPPLVVIAGPTAVGKTALSVRLAQELGAEIVSADSMLVYRNMDIGTAKPTQQEMGGIIHHLIDILDPEEHHCVANFVSLAKACISDITNRGKLPILVGGTGFYINALVYDKIIMSSEFGGEDSNFRKDIYATLERKGAIYLHNKLMSIDPISASNMHPNNVKRVVRALEYHHVTGLLFSAGLPNQQSTHVSQYDLGMYILSAHNRNLIYERINKRVDAMVEMGLVGEVRGLLERRIPPGSTSMQGIGYKELVPHIYGKASLEQAITEIKRNTRRFAKRQLTWFRNQVEAVWKYIDESTERCIIDSIVQSIAADHHKKE